MFLTFTLIPLDPPVIDVAGIVNRYETQISQANSATGTLSFVRGGAAGTNRFFLEKPGKVAVISSNQKDICDGTKRLIIRPDEKTYETRPVALYGMPYQIGFEPFFSSLTSPSGNRMAFDSGRLATDATSVVVRRRTTQGSDVMEVNLDRTTGLPVGWTWLHNGQVTTARILDLVLDGPIPAGMFTPDLTGYRETPTPEAQALLPVGSIGPDLPLVGSNGRPTTLSQFAAKQAKTILVFVNPADPTSVAHLRQPISGASTE